MSGAPASGEQLELVAGDVRAVIATVGATVRVLEHGGRPLVRSFDADEVRPKYRGATLAPWPNRVVDGRWRLDGAVQQLALTEPDRGHALHGLVAWLPFAVRDRSASSVTLAARIAAQDGYPFTVDVEVTFTVDDAGLHTEVRGTNVGTGDAPFGVAPHPYLVAPGERVDEWTLHLPADRVLHVDDRLAPTELGAVGEDAERFDFRTPRAIGTTELDHAFTGLARDADGVCTVSVTDAAGVGAAVRFGAECGWVQVHTADLPDAHASRRGVAVEPMTCPPDAFNSGTDVVWLAPGASTAASWRIDAIG